MRRAISRHLSIVGLVLFIASTEASADEGATAAPATGAPATAHVQLPFWMTPEVLKAAIEIKMTDVQMHDFNEVVGQYVTDHFAMIQREAKREAADLDVRVRSRDGALARKMDEQVRAILTTEQMPAYGSYRKVLREQLKNAPLPQTSAGTRTSHAVGGPG
jgi:phage terminase small subunit